MTQGNWVEREPGLGAARLALSCMWNRARRRWVVVVLLAALLASVVALLRSQTPRLYASTVYLSVSETSLEQAAPPTAHELRQHLNHVSLSTTNIIRIMNKTGLHDPETATTPDLAVQRFRERVSVTVTHHYVGPLAEATVSSSTIGIRFFDENPERALAVVRAIATGIAQEQSSTRRRDGRLMHQAASGARAEIRSQLAEDRRQLSALAARAAGAEGAERARIELSMQALAGSIAEAERALDDMARQQSLESMREHTSQSGVDLEFRLIDRGHLASPRALSKTQEVQALGAVAFVMLLPIVAMTVGTLDSRVWGADDLARIGIDTIAQVPLGELKAHDEQPAERRSTSWPT